MNIKIKKEYMKVSDFDKLELEDVNYTGDLFVFDKRINDNVSMAFDRWQIGKRHREATALNEGTFYIENCDIQDLTLFEMFEYLGEDYGIHRLVRIVPDDWDD